MGAVFSALALRAPPAAEFESQPGAPQTPNERPSLESSASSFEVALTKNPAYPPEELATIFLDFYKFLATLHYSAHDLKVAPSGGWPTLTPETCAGHGKSDTTIEVMRRLPYFASDAHIHYKSQLVDYSSMGRRFFAESNPRDEWFQKFESSEGDEVDSSDIISIAWGYESGGRELLLNVRHGEIIEEMIRYNRVGSFDVKAYFAELMEAYRSLKLIPSLGRETIEADDVEERDEIITEEEVRTQAEDWGTNLDVQYIRQIYRQHGWPDSYRREEAEKAVEELMDSMDDDRGSWY